MDTKESRPQDLHDEDAVEKMEELVKKNSMCFFSTDLDHIPPQSRPMSVQHLDSDGNFWFLSAQDSHKNAEIQRDNRVQLLFANPSDSEYMTVFGTALITTSKKRIDDLWSPMVKEWFTEGRNDLRITVLQVIPNEAYSWDSKSGKMVSMLKTLASASTGSTHDVSLEGYLK